MNSRKVQILVLFIAIGLILPSILNDYYLHVAIMILFYAYLGSSWNIIGGYAGQYFFGPAAFYGLGAYTSTYCFVKWGISPWVGMFIGALVAMLLAIFISRLTFRFGLKGIFFGLTTIAFTEILKLVFTSWAMGGGAGINIPLVGSSPLLFQFGSKSSFYYIIFGYLFLVLFVTHKTMGAKFGYFLIAIRDNEDAAESLGIAVNQYKLRAMVLSAFFIALGGSFYAQYILFIDPEVAFRIEVLCDILIPPIIGGLGRMFGSLIGSAIMVTASQLTSILFGEITGMNPMVYGLFFVLVMLYLPNGILSYVDNLRKNRVKKEVKL